MVQHQSLLVFLSSHIFYHNYFCTYSLCIIHNTWILYQRFTELRNCKIKKMKLRRGNHFHTGKGSIYSRLSSSISSACAFSYSRLIATSPLTFNAPLVNEMPSSSKSSPASSMYAYLHVQHQRDWFLQT